MSTTLTLREAAQALPSFDDPRVKLVYELLCSFDKAPNPEEHWEGWTARRIVAALATLTQAADAGAAEAVAYRVRYRAEPGMIGHYPWSYIEAKRAKHRMEAHEYEALYAAPPAQQLQQAVAREWEACRAACEAIADEYERREGHKYPELKSDAQTGADDCERAISARGDTHGL